MTTGVLISLQTLMGFNFSSSSFTGTLYDSLSPTPFNVSFSASMGLAFATVPGFFVPGSHQFTLEVDSSIFNPIPNANQNPAGFILTFNNTPPTPPTFLANVGGTTLFAGIVFIIVSPIVVTNTTKITLSDANPSADIVTITVPSDFQATISGTAKFNVQVGSFAAATLELYDNSNNVIAKGKISSKSGSFTVNISHFGSFSGSNTFTLRATNTMSGTVLIIDVGAASISIT